MGEAPGHSEDLLGEAFIGPSGKLLDEIIERSGISLEDCFFTNTILCRPSNVKGEDREPVKEEIRNCSKWVKSILRIAEPEYMVFVGKIAANNYNGYAKQIGITTVTLVHPAAILRTGKESIVQYNVVLLRRLIK